MTDSEKLLAQAKQLVTEGKIDMDELRDLIRVMDQLEEYDRTAGLEKWFVPGSEYGIDKLPKHAAAIRATKDYREVLVLGANRCLLEGTLVATPKGPVPIEELVVGDEVYDRYGQPTKVVATWDNGEADVVKLVNRGKHYLTCTPNHGLDCIRQERNEVKYSYPQVEEKKTASQLSNRNLVRRVNVKASLGNVQEPHAYVIGAMLGDGCCTCGTGVSMMLSSINEKIPSKVASILSTTYTPSKGSYSWRIGAHCNYYKEWMKDRYSYDKLVDVSVLRTWDRQSLVEFVAGLIDTDGSLTSRKDGHQLSLHSQNLDILKAFEYCVLALWNEHVSISKDSREKYVNGAVYAATIRNPYKIRLATEELHPHLVHKYKAEIKEDVFGGKRSRPDALRLTAIPAGRGRVYDITVAHEEHFFLLANGLSVSNSGKTTVGCYITAVLATGMYPDNWEGVYFDEPIDAWSVGMSAQTTRDTLQKALLGEAGNFGTGMIPRACIGKSKMSAVGGAVDYVKIKHTSGRWSEIGFKAYKQDTASFFGVRRHWAHLDEPAPELVYAEVLVRTAFEKGRQQGRVFHTITPKEGLTRLLADLLSTSEFLAGSEDIPNLKLARALMEAEAAKHARD